MTIDINNVPLHARIFVLKNYDKLIPNAPHNRDSLQGEYAAK